MLGRFGTDVFGTDVTARSEKLFRTDRDAGTQDSRRILARRVRALQRVSRRQQKDRCKQIPLNLEKRVRTYAERIARHRIGGTDQRHRKNQLANVNADTPIECVDEIGELQPPALRCAVALAHARARAVS